MSKRNKIWVGRSSGNINGYGFVFRNPTEPTVASHGATYAAVIGPFRTIRGATWMAHPQRGRDNPHCQCVADAERLAKKYASDYNPKTQSWPEPDA